MLDQAEQLRKLVKNKNMETKKAKIITVTSGKGGVGKSNFVVNTALELVQAGYKTLIFDADIGMGNDDILMGLYPQNNVMDIIEGNLSIEDVIVEGPRGVHLLPGGSGLNNIDDLTEDERKEFLKKIEKLNDYDFILIDTGAGINKSVLAFIAASEEVIIILTPEPTSLTDGYSLLKAISYFNLSNSIKIVVNRAPEKDEAKKTFTKLEKSANKFLKIHIKLLGFIYEDKKLVSAVKKQNPITLEYPKSGCSMCIRRIAEKIIINSAKKTNIPPNVEEGATGLFKKLFKIFA